MTQAFVIKRLADGRYYKNGPKRHTWKFNRMSREEQAAQIDKDHWTPDLQKARTYTNRGGAKSVLGYKADETAFEFVSVKLVEA